MRMSPVDPLRTTEDAATLVVGLAPGHRQYCGRMTAWAVRGVELPFGDREQSWWLDDSGTVGERPIDGAEQLPGRYVLKGLVDAHSHPAMGEQADGMVLRSEEQIRATLVSWAETGITLVRDVGSPGGLMLNLGPRPGEPDVRAAGRFLAPEHRYFEDLLVEPVSGNDLVEAALQQVRLGATWVKVIGDFPLVPELTDTARTYPVELIASLCEAVHVAGARVAVHTTLADVGAFISAGIDSIEHGPGLDASDVEEMGRRGVAWTPTLCAMFPAVEDPETTPEQREQALETRARLTELLPLAVRHGVPVLAGTDVVGSIPREVAMLSEMGLEPSQALAAASDWARRFIGADAGRTDIVTYEHDPRDDPTQLAHPAAVVMAGNRLR